MAAQNLPMFGQIPTVTGHNVFNTRQLVLFYRFMTIHLGLCFVQLNSELVKHLSFQGKNYLQSYAQNRRVLEVLKKMTALNILILLYYKMFKYVMDQLLAWYKKVYQCYIIYNKATQTISVGAIV